MGWQDFDGRELTVARWPADGNDGLRAWDAADEYLLRQLREQRPRAGSRVLLVDDAWGALGAALAAWQPVAWGDSHLGHLALKQNLERNGLDPRVVTFVPATDTPVGPFDLALLRLPRDLACLDDTLRRLRPLLAPEAELLAGGMIKHTPSRAWRRLEHLIGPTTTTAGWKKARLGSARAEAHDAWRSPAPPGIHPGYRLPDEGLELVGAPGVFGGGRLDRGADLLRRHLPVTDQPLAAADLGCGDGILALAIARRCPRTRVLGIDASHRAIACARANLARNFIDPDDAGRIRLEIGDGLADVEPASLDLVACNPPFHQGHAVADIAAERMFIQARQALRPGGRLLVVGNRHLGHHAKLERLFGHHELVDGDARFTVVAATRHA